MALPTTMTMLLLPFLLLIAFSGWLPRWVLASPPTFTERLEVSQQHPTEATYLHFMTRLDAAVKHTTGDSILDRPLLRDQTVGKPPASWVNVELTDAAGHPLLTLALRSDNLYVSGFMNRHSEWFAFNGEEHTLPSKSVSRLSYGGSYADIFGRGVAWRGLANVQVNRAMALANALLLADYRSGGHSSDEALKPALAFFILTIAEAERFPRLRAKLAGVMDARQPQTMSRDMVQRAVNWKTLSCALRAWVEHKRSPDAWNANFEAGELKRQINVNTPKEALDEIQPLLRSNGCTWTLRLTNGSASVRAE